MLAKTFTLVRVAFRAAGASPKKIAFEILKLKVIDDGEISLLRLKPSGRSLTDQSILTSLPVVMVYRPWARYAIVFVRKTPKGRRAFTVVSRLWRGVVISDQSLFRL